MEVFQHDRGDKSPAGPQDAIPFMNRTNGIGKMLTNRNRQYGFEAVVGQWQACGIGARQPAMATGIARSGEGASRQVDSHIHLPTNCRQREFPAAATKIEDRTAHCDLR